MHSPRARQSLATAAIVIAVLLPVGACGGASGSNSAAAAGAGQPSSAQNGAGAGSGNRAPGTYGLVAEISGTTLQVQSSDSQTAVTYTSRTRFSQTVETTRAAVKTGDCVVVRSKSTTGATTPTGTPTALSAQPSAVTATAVEVTATATGGRCAPAGFGGGGFGSGPGGFRSGGSATGATGGARPTDAPTLQTGRLPGGAGQRPLGQVTFGTVTSVSRSGFVVAAATFEGRQGATGQPTSSSSSSGTSTPAVTPPVSTHAVTVTTTAATTYTVIRSSTAKALAVGSCVAARGKADDTGAVTATSIAISPADNGQCTTRGL